METRWQAHWERNATFRTPNPGDPDFDASRPKYFCLDMFPYPSGAGLHVGHPEGYTATDIICRYKRHRGFNVLHPMGWDAFGLPAEQYAIATGVHPAVTTRRAIDTFRRQLRRFGFSYDWSREFATIDPDYYRWTQWIWLKAYDSWFDPDANRARPIADLEAAFARGDRVIAMNPEHAADADPHAGEGRWPDWNAVDPATRRVILDSYRLAYVATQTVNWCPKLGTALANEEVIDGRSERGGYPVVRQPLKQWMFRITAYAERLLEDLDRVSWPESTRTMQREWIGRSEGAEIDFPLIDGPPDAPDTLRVYTTRPDTIFGATYMVLAPEHPLVAGMLATPRPGTDVAAIRAYVETAANRSDIDRQAESKVKTGVPTGFTARNPATGAAIPIWIADYVLMGYGHGAIMAVPAHDERDFEFARAFELPIVTVVEPIEPLDDPDTLFSGAGRAVNSSGAGVSLDGLETAAAKTRIIEWLATSGSGRARVNYKLRDWLFSRQRYWGEPFPVVFDNSGMHHPVDADHLPVTLPEMDDYAPIESETPTPLLGKATAWVNTTAAEAGVTSAALTPTTPVRREANTMPGWAGSCWYYLRFCSPRCEDRLVDREAERYWMLSRRDGARADTEPDAFDPDTHHVGGVDLYIGGAEHAVLHLLYARFWHKLLYDHGLISTPEPFGQLFHQGMITAHAYQRPDKSLVPVDAVREDGDRIVEIETGEPVIRTVAKMSKSLKNVVNPDDVIAEYGADTFRLYEMYMGPLEASKPWNTRDMVGLFRVLQRIWRLFVDEETGAASGRIAPRGDDRQNEDLERLLHRTIAGVEQDIDRIRLNTAIAKIIELTNELVATPEPVPFDIAERFLIILSPFAPHLAEELFSRLGHESLIAHATWPSFDGSMLHDDTIELPIQINGKVRSRVSVPADANEEAVREHALADERVQSLLEGLTVRKLIVVPGKIVNIIAR
ncbi:MAG: leucine--tRNA ligase [Phycisphaerales bacterium]|nr:leucine--tRNA ligase [Phycisphaerales bacterium]